MTFLNSIDPFFKLGSFVVCQAALHDCAGKFEKSVQDASRSDLQLPLNSSDQINDVADFLLAEHRNDDAIALFEFNTAQHPESGIDYDRLGRAYRSLGQHSPALEAYEKALGFDPATGMPAPPSAASLNLLRKSGSRKTSLRLTSPPRRSIIPPAVSSLWPGSYFRPQHRPLKEDLP
jgi:tetratricopeptide (TPR) repeat protein